MEKFVNDKIEIVEQTLGNFEFSQESYEDILDMSLTSKTHMKPIAFFGLSGVGKTTLAHGLVDLAPDQFSLIPITTSRLPRDDDDLRYIEFLSQIDFISNREEGCFAMSWQQDGNYYGYRHKYLKNTQKSPIMTCSPSAIQILKEYGAITVLIKGDGVKGLEARGSDEVTKNRTLLNIKNTEKYLNQLWFKENIDIEYDQMWGDIPRSIQNLYDSIIDILE